MELPAWASKIGHAARIATSEAAANAAKRRTGTMDRPLFRKTRKHILPHLAAPEQQTSVSGV
jgi:hypothetical protein